jgi:hypothetical protein
LKRILIPVGGAVLATGLLAAGLTTSAQATPDIATDPLAPSVTAAQSVADFWGKANGAALKSATAVNYWNDGADVGKLQSKGGYTPDGKAGTVAPIGQEKKTTAKVKNINLPKTIGKVFFENAKGELKWCSATSIQGQYKNLVATAGHCVYDTASNAATLKKWVFVPGYYQGKAPWGVYVGKTAYTHYDFDVYEDYDRDYAFVTVSNGIQIGGGKASKVTKAEYGKFTGLKEVKPVAITKAEYEKCNLDLGDCFAVGEDKDPTPVGPDYPDAALTKVEVSKGKYEAAKTGPGNGNKIGAPVTENVTEAEYNAYKGVGSKAKDSKGNFTITHYYVQQWVKPGEVKKYYANEYWIVEGHIKDLGRLGDVVGGQGFAWNQKTGQKVFVFGYPSAPHPDGHKAYTGVTPKWCYGTTSAKTVGSAAKKIEEHIALKCAMTEGSNGSPWLVKYSNAKRLGYLNGVTSTFNDQDGNNRVDYISSAYFDGETRSVYNAAQKNWSGSIVK